MNHTNTKHDDFAAGLLIGVMLLAAVLMATPAAAAEEDTRLRIELAVEERLGCDVSVHELSVLPESSGLELELSWPSRDECCLPTLLKLRSGERLVRSLSLRRLVEFELPVVVSTGPIASRTLLGNAQLGLESRRLSAGSEVLLSLDEAVGSESRGRLAEGEAVRASRLKPALDLRRGDELLLLLGNNSVSLSALAEALGDGYVGQTVRVARIADGKKYSGILSRSAEGRLQVVVE